MEQRNPDGIDAFLESLSTGVGQQEPQTEAKPRQNLEVRVRFARSNGLYPVIVHLIALGGGVTEQDLEGELLRGQWTFRANSLLDFSEFYAFSVFEIIGGEYHPWEGIRYHVDPPLPTEDYGRVSYRLVTKLDDPQGDQLLELVRIATNALFLNYTPPS